MRLFVLCFCLLFFGCSQKETSRPNISHPKTSKEGEKVLMVGEIMALKNREIIKGSCWDYIDTVFNRAGFPSNKRAYIFKAKKSLQTLVPTHLIQAGDWLYFINHSYSKVEHSGIFVRWINQAKYQALLLSYQGEQRKNPARYSTYNIKNTYTIIRARR